MYRINYDDFLLHDLQVPSEHGYYLKNPVLKEEVNKTCKQNGIAGVKRSCQFFC